MTNTTIRVNKCLAKYHITMDDVFTFAVYSITPKKSLEINI